jgi:hydrogenase maturation protein HypF
VRNDGAGVTIEVEGEDGGHRRVRPPRARRRAAARARRSRAEHGARASAARGFAIVETRGGRAATAIGPDSAVCADCIAEMLDPVDRAGVSVRELHELRAALHDHARALRPGEHEHGTLAMCPACSAEYAVPSNRRFHAEPNACPACGPQLTLLDGAGRPLAGVDPIAATLGRVLAGEIVAIKGLGGFHLVCDARNAAAVARLRERKAREKSRSR